MKRELVEDLVCPVSSHPLLVESEADTCNVEAGELVCVGCDRRWPIRHGIPRLVPPELDEQQRKTASAFGWQWQHFVEMHPEFEDQFLDWVHPIEPEFFREKRVLDAGCGIGRHAYYAASYGAREVVAVDLSDAVETAGRTLAELDNVHVVQGDLFRLPLRTAAEGGGFDLVYSIGVLHHLSDPAEGFRRLLDYVRPGGTIAVWVYGHENNGFVRNVVEPVRRLSTRMPPSVLRGLAWPLALGFHGVACGVYRPLHGTAVGRLLPHDDYLSSVGSYSFRQNYAIVFDQLVAPTSAYIQGPELESWFHESGLDEVQISHRHENSWRGHGRIPPAKA
ncbi:MAG: methyltransferase domain-containing protein [Gaiellaceae bacterium]